MGGPGQSRALLATRRAADKAYRGPKQKKIAGQATDIHTSSNTAIKEVVSTLDTSTILDTTGKNKADIKNKEGEQSGIKLVSSEVEKSGEVYVQPANKSPITVFMSRSFVRIRGKSQWSCRVQTSFLRKDLY